MPKYYFHMREHDALVEDPDGADLPDIAAAREEALRAAREMVVEMVARGEIIDGQQFVICDDTGKHLDVVPFTSALRLR